MIGCTAQTSKSRFLLADKLWNEGKYSASVKEYDSVIQKEGSSDLSVQAQFKAAKTEMIFTKEYYSAIRRFNRVIELRPKTILSLESQKMIGEILYQYLENDEQAIQHYTKMIELRETDPDRPEYYFRVSQSLYRLMRFEESIQTLETLIKLYPESRWAEGATYFLGQSTEALANQKQQKGENSTELFKLAIERYKIYLNKYKEGQKVWDAELEIATCYEEIDQLVEAEKYLMSLKSNSLLNPKIQEKLNRIKARKTQKMVGS